MRLDHYTINGLELFDICGDIQGS